MTTHPTSQPNLLLSILILLSALPLKVYTHGTLISPNGLGSPGMYMVRNYDKIATNIDALRSSLISNTGLNVCRNAPVSSQRANVVFGPSGSTHTITMAFSVGAMHVGPCSVEIIDPATGIHTEITSIAGPQGCARPGPSVQPNIDTDKSAPASVQCPGRIPQGLRTDDMCMYTWTFVLKNVEKIACKKCVLRWMWEATHLSPSEFFETCSDINLTINGGSQQSSQVNTISNTAFSTPKQQTSVKSSSTTSTSTTTPVSTPKPPTSTTPVAVNTPDIVTPTSSTSLSAINVVTSTSSSKGRGGPVLTKTYNKHSNGGRINKSVKTTTNKKAAVSKTVA
ncbi:hypothetical protein HDU76_007222, partial [Blyttiomyces sp. JEL0837]